MEDEEDNFKKTTNFKIILASGSPRRSLILKKLKLDFIILKPEDVTEAEFQNPYKTVLYNARLKANWVYNFLLNSEDLNKIQGVINSVEINLIIAGFDTSIYLGRNYLVSNFFLDSKFSKTFKTKVIGKPKDYEDAKKILNILSGRTHLVITGVFLIDLFSGKTVYGCQTTKVKFRNLNNLEISKYLSIENFLDKAGGYDINSFGMLLVEKINGCFYNVAGLPIAKFLELLKKLGYSIL